MSSDLVFLDTNVLLYGVDDKDLAKRDRARAWDAAEQLRQVLESGEWQRPEFNQRQAVT